MRRPVAVAHGALLFAALIYSGYNVLLAQSLRHLSPVTFSLCRELVAIPLLYAWAARAEAPVRVPRTRGEWRYMAAFGLVLGLFQLCFATGVSLTSATAAAIFQCVEPTTAAVMGAACGAEPCTWRKFVSAALAGGGVALLQLGGGGGGATESAGGAGLRALGSGLLFCQGVGIATYCLLQKRLVRGDAGRADDGDGALLGGGDGDDPPAPRDRRWGPITLTAHACVGSCAVMLLAALVDTAAGIESTPPLSKKAFGAVFARAALAAVAYAAVLSSVVGYSLRAWANRYVDAATLVLYNAVQPPMTALIALVLTPKTAAFGWRQGGATALVVAAVWVAAREAPPKPPPLEADGEGGGALN